MKDRDKDIHRIKIEIEFRQWEKDLFGSEAPSKDTKRLKNKLRRLEKEKRVLDYFADSELSDIDSLGN